jgi:hypothetical protein
MQTTLPSEPAKDYNDWMQYIFKQLGYTQIPQEKIDNPVGFAEWLTYIRQERNRPCR